MKPKKKTNPDVKEFITAYHDGFLEKFGTKPVIAGGKDGATAKRLLAVHSLDTLKGLLGDFFRSNDEWIAKSGHTIGVFSSQVNKLVTAKSRIPAVSKYSSGAIEWLAQQEDCG